jgi:hypothetical protein
MKMRRLNMQNIEMDVQGDILTVTIDLTKRGGVSNSGKTISVATTSGGVSVPDHKDIKIGINAYVKNPDYKEDK